MQKSYINWGEVVSGSGLNLVKKIMNCPNFKERELTLAEYFSSSEEFSVETSADPSEPCPESERVLMSNLGSLLSVDFKSSSLY